MVAVGGEITRERKGAASQKQIPCSTVPNPIKVPALLLQVWKAWQAPEALQQCVCREQPPETTSKCQKSGEFIVMLPVRAVLGGPSTAGTGGDTTLGFEHLNRDPLHILGGINEVGPWIS